ncbi:MAG: 50S ribosomal protein L29 [Bdellovibrionales bacterium]|nr:50S ribosomal protein L29 [Bdellovibrionales bacterium]
MKFKDISGLKEDELRKKSKQLRQDLFQLEVKNSLGQLGNPLEIRFLRRDVARIETAIRQKSN